jgi:hypothetical protein
MSKPLLLPLRSALMPWPPPSQPVTDAGSELRLVTRQNASSPTGTLRIDDTPTVYADDSGHTNAGFVVSNQCTWDGVPEQAAATESRRFGTVRKGPERSVGLGGHILRWVLV